MLNGERKIARPLRWAMIGGGRTAQVGYKHRTGRLEITPRFSWLPAPLILMLQEARILA